MAHRAYPVPESKITGGVGARPWRRVDRLVRRSAARTCSRNTAGTGGAIWPVLRAGPLRGWRAWLTSHRPIGVECGCGCHGGGCWSARASGAAPTAAAAMATAVARRMWAG